MSASAKVSLGADQSTLLFLRHCVYSRYASLKRSAITGIYFGQDCLGHSIARLGQLAERWYRLIAVRSIFGDGAFVGF